MLVRSPSVLPEIEDMGITSPSRSFMQQRRLKKQKSRSWHHERLFSFSLVGNSGRPQI
ncbi:MAG: hypothetical protein VB125_02810 [Burkholderia sp.]